MSDDERTVSEDNIRIAPDLQEQLRAEALNEEAGFAFVDQIRETDDPDVIEVIFELPHGKQTFSRRFTRVRSENTQYPSIQTLYDLADEATLTEPRSILYTSVPVVAEEGYDLPNIGEPASQTPSAKTTPVSSMDPRAQAGSDDTHWMDRQRFYSELDFDAKYKLIPLGAAALGFLIGFIAASPVTTLTVWVVTAILVYGASQWFERLRVPPEAEMLDGADDIEAISPGDIIIVDQSGARNPRERVVFRVEDRNGHRIKGTLASGQHVAVNANGWYVDGPVPHHSYETAFRIPKSRV